MVVGDDITILRDNHPGTESALHGLRFLLLLAWLLLAWLLLTGAEKEIEHAEGVVSLAAVLVSRAGGVAFDAHYGVDCFLSCYRKISLKGRHSG